MRSLATLGFAGSFEKTVTCVGLGFFPIILKRKRKSKRKKADVEICI